MVDMQDHMTESGSVVAVGRMKNEKTQTSKLDHVATFPHRFSHSYNTFVQRAWLNF